jgi:hypothetical protein
MLKKIFNDCFTGKNDTTYDLFKFLFTVGFFVLCYLIIARNASLTEGGTVLGAYLTLGATSLFIKRSTEPDK